jgi:hypothetical protein
LGNKDRPEKKGVSGAWVKLAMLIGQFEKEAATSRLRFAYGLYWFGHYQISVYDSVVTPTQICPDKVQVAFAATVTVCT